MTRTKFSELCDAEVAKPGAVERLAALRAETVDDTSQLNETSRRSD